MTIFRNNHGYPSLDANLKGHWEKPFDDLPDELKPLVAAAFDLVPWDRLAPHQRQSFSGQHDCKHDPATESEHERCWKVWCEIDDKNRKIDELERAPAPTAHDVILRNDRLLVLRQQREELKAQLDGSNGSSPNEYIRFVHGGEEGADANETQQTGDKPQSEQRTPHAVQGARGNNGQKPVRVNALTAIINKARAQAADPNDTSSVFAVLVQMATNPKENAPLLGFSADKDEGIKYQDQASGDTIKYLTKDALRRRIKRSNKRSSS